MTTTAKTPKNKVYEIITNRIIEKIQAGSPLPWSQPWKPGEMPHNVSGRPYSGMNVFTLAMEKAELAEAIPPAYTEFIGKIMIKEFAK